MYKKQKQRESRENSMTDIYKNLSEKEMKLGYWFVTNKILLRRMVIVVLLIFTISTMFYGLFGLIKHYLWSSGDIEKSINRIGQPKLNYELLVELNTPQSLTIKDPAVIKSNGTLNLAVEVFNPNASWFLESFDYYFKSGAQETEKRTDFVLPGQNKMLYKLNYSDQPTFNNPQLVVENPRWRKVANYRSLEEKFIDFRISDVVLRREQSSDGSVSFTNLQFEISNLTAFSYFEPKFTAMIYKGNRLVGIAPIFLQELNSGQKVRKNINFFMSYDPNAKVLIEPDINILAPDSFKAVGFDSGELK